MSSSSSLLLWATFSTYTHALFPLLSFTSIQYSSSVIFTPFVVVFPVTLTYRLYHRQFSATALHNFSEIMLTVWVIMQQTPQVQNGKYIISFRWILVKCITLQMAWPLFFRPTMLLLPARWAGVRLLLVVSLKLSYAWRSSFKSWVSPSFDWFSRYICEVPHLYHFT